jgi:hypothetical protein
MDKDKKPSPDTETILMALDQVSQTIDVMTSVVGRLRNYLQEQETAAKGDTGKQSTTSEMEASRTVH